MSAAGYVVAFPAAVNDSGRVVDDGRFVPRRGLVGRPWVDRSGLAERFATAAAASVIADRLNGGGRIADPFGRRWCVVEASGGCPVVLVDCVAPAGRVFRRSRMGGAGWCKLSPASRSGREGWTIGDACPALCKTKTEN